MSGSTLVGVVLIGVAALDLVFGNLFVAPRAPEESRAVLRIAFAVSAFVMIAVGALFLTGTLGVGA